MSPARPPHEEESVTRDGTARTPLTRNQARALREAGNGHHTLREARIRLHRALVAAQGGREAAWAGAVHDALLVAREALRRHREQVEGPHGLYDEIALEAPWLLKRVETMREALRRAEDDAGRLAGHLERARGGDLRGVEAIRPDAERLTALLRHLMSLENDLAFERFRDTVALD
jgi:hypothetical protein